MKYTLGLIVGAVITSIIWGVTIFSWSPDLLIIVAFLVLGSLTAVATEIAKMWGEE